MTQTNSSAHRRLVAVGRYEAGEPVYAACDPNLLAAGTTGPGKPQAAQAMLAAYQDAIKRGERP